MQSLFQLRRPMVERGGGLEISLEKVTMLVFFPFICDFIAIPQTNTCSNKCQFEIVIFNYFVNKFLVGILPADLQNKMSLGGFFLIKLNHKQREYTQAYK